PLSAPPTRRSSDLIACGSSVAYKASPYRIEEGGLDQSGVAEVGLFLAHAVQQALVLVEPAGQLSLQSGYLIIRNRHLLLFRLERHCWKSSVLRKVQTKLWLQ